MSPETLIPLNLRAALQTRLEANSRLENRQSYIGASEVGGCLRRLVAAKSHPETFDFSSMGRILAGKAMEAEIVQLVRLALNGSLRNTGRNQLDAQHPEIPFHAHPDGRIVGSENQGDGVLEVKTASASIFKRYQTEGLPQQYLDQVQAQMGLTGLSWALVVLVSRENLAELATFHVQFSPDHFTRLYNRASTCYEAVNSGLLPDGEPDRGYCHSCPIAGDCPQHQALRKAISEGELPELVRLKLDCEIEELAAVEAELSPLQMRSSELRERIKTTLQDLGASKVTLDCGVAQITGSSRTSFDSKALQREAPDLYSRYLKTNSFTSLRMTFRGDQP